MASNLPTALPIAQHADDPGPRQQYIAEDPAWIERTQPSNSKGGPWIVRYRGWSKDARYKKFGGEKLPGDRIALWFRNGHKQWYQVPRDIYEQFLNLKTSVGSWLHDTLLVGGRDGKYPVGPEE